ncbi:MAG: AraC family transcriptional regulator [bacterium]
MDKVTKNMDILSILKIPPFRSEKFRTPSSTEKKLQLWIDRIGSASEYSRNKPMRILGLYAVLHVELGRGYLISPLTGKIRLKTGDSFFLFPNVPHTYSSIKGKWATCWIVFDGPLCKTYENLGYMNPKNPVIYDQECIVYQTFKKMQVLMERDDTASHLERSANMTALIMELYKHRNFTPAQHRHKNLILRVTQYLTEHCHENIKPPEVAKRFAASYTHLRRLFRRDTGFSIKEFITYKRISKAKALILEKKLPLKQIAQQTGYNDVFLFMRTFKKIADISPGKFEKNHTM